LSGSQADKLYYLMRVRARGVVVDVRLNDMPAHAERTGEEASVSGEYNNLIIKGDNELKTTIRPLEGDEKPAPDAKVEVLLAEARKGQKVDEAKELLAFVWPSEEEKEEGEAEGEEGTKGSEKEEKDEEAFPVVDVQTVKIEGPLGGWAWEGADAIAPTPETTDGILATLRMIHKAFEEFDEPTLLAAVDARMTEMATAHFVDKGDLVHAFQADVREAWNDAQWGMEPLDESALEMDLAAGGRVVWIRDKEWKSPIRSVELSEGHRIGVNVLLTQVKKQWVIVR
jgi:hypothetical protein